MTRANLRENTASFYARVEPDGFVTLVLGAGNIASIPPLDVLTALYAHGSVALLKLNPVNAYLAPVFARIFSSLIDEGFVRIADGGADVGAYLGAHPAIDAIHLTGGERTHDAIVFGGGDEGAARKRAGQPVVTKRVTSELGNITPVIVVPGPWSEADLDFHAAHVATQKLHNAGANCIAAQVVVTAATWDLAPRFLAKVRARSAQRRRARRTIRARASACTPSSASIRKRRARACRSTASTARSSAGSIRRTPDEPLFHNEAFGPVLAQTALPGADAAEFLRNAVAFANDKAARHARRVDPDPPAHDPRAGRRVRRRGRRAALRLRRGEHVARHRVLARHRDVGRVPRQHGRRRRQRHRHRAQRVPVRQAAEDRRARAVRAVPALAAERRTNAAAGPAVVRHAPPRGSRGPQAVRVHGEAERAAHGGDGRWRRCARRASPFEFYAYSRA